MYTAPKVAYGGTAGPSVTVHPTVFTCFSMSCVIGSTEARFVADDLAAAGS